MPHCIIEYSKTIEIAIDLDSVIDNVFEAVSESDLFERSSVKVRAIGYDFYKSGLDDHNFIHVCIRILSGRNKQQKKILSNAVLSRLSQVTEGVKSITIEVVDMETTCYSKQES